MSDTQYGFVFVRENCIQCHACEVACKSWRNTEPGVKWRHVENIWEGSYPDVKCFSISVSCMHCIDPACVNACPEDAISKRPDDGVVVVDAGKCVGCRTCSDTCPFGVPRFGADGKMQKCDMCIGQRASDDGNPPCVRTCPTEALVLVKMDVEETRRAEETMARLLSSRAPL